MSKRRREGKRWMSCTTEAVVASVPSDKEKSRRRDMVTALVLHASSMSVPTLPVAASEPKCKEKCGSMTKEERFGRKGKEVKREDF